MRIDALKSNDDANMVSIINFDDEDIGNLNSTLGTVINSLIFTELDKVAIFQ
jgi:hypothetical protein